jgi:hypothetical protein
VTNWDFFGDSNIEVKGVACMWSVDTQSIAAAAKKTLNLIITHEHPWISNQKSEWLGTGDEESDEKEPALANFVGAKPIVLVITVTRALVSLARSSGLQYLHKCGYCNLIR